MGCTVPFRVCVFFIIGVYVDNNYRLITSHHCRYLDLWYECLDVKFLVTHQFLHWQIFKFEFLSLFRSLNSFLCVLKLEFLCFEVWISPSLLIFIYFSLSSLFVDIWISLFWSLNFFLCSDIWISPFKILISPFIAASNSCLVLDSFKWQSHIFQIMFVGNCWQPCDAHRQRLFCRSWVLSWHPTRSRYKSPRQNGAIRYICEGSTYDVSYRNS